MSKQWFAWKALNDQQTMLSGLQIGEDAAEVQARLRSEGYFPVAIRKCKKSLKEFVLYRGKVRWSFQTRRLANLLEAGIPLLQALEIMTLSKSRLTFEQKQWQRVKDQVMTGGDLAEALKDLDSPPSPYALSMIKAGEYAGNVGKALSDVADELERDDTFRLKIQTALAYPMLLVIAVLVVLLVLSTGVLPMYERLFASMDVELPFVTRVIFMVGRVLPFFLLSLFFLTAGGILVFRFKNPGNWKINLKGLIGHLPLLSKIYRLSDLVQFTRILGCLLTTGIPLLEALNLTADTLRSSGMLKLTEQLVQSVRQGNRMAYVLSASGIFPEEGAEMVAVAEETGKLDMMFYHITCLFRKDLEYQLERLTRMVEPALILLLAGFIGVVAGGVMLPIFELSSHV
ncbi:type II secretion system F family protein [Desulfosporosinus sp. PR]|uniref:type II secretion system F family protein n=1 Tax=Candidatus Desulfosporosinus nitrosoreducens TaxID=3401928 RepID=UPI0027FC64CE|nr:type II secretion system F family protein [Desulfosporosinus sp. PR]MDQ7095767.1 type II secretion system F family protein [Desulfosporosinus sp. PR]